MMSLRIAIAIFLLMLSGSALAEVVVIVSKDNEVTSLTRNEIIDIFMGRTHRFPIGNPVLPVDHSGKSEIKRIFYRSLMNKSPAEINAYWAKLLFTGRASPPKIIDDAELLIEMVAENPAAIGYIDSSMLNDRVKVVAHVE